jgi:hypothetical protein
MAGSEVQQFRQQQALQEEAAYQGLYGLAAVARHAIITARMEQMALHIQHLAAQGKHQEAQAILLDDDLWTAMKGAHITAFLALRGDRRIFMHDGHQREKPLKRIRFVPEWKLLVQLNRVSNGRRIVFELESTIGRRSHAREETSQECWQ